MPIQPTDIKLLASERMRDTADGGGRMTGNVIPSGEAGNIFPKVSRVDAVYGRVNLRKIYLAVRTATLDMYAGAHAIITDPPNNQRIGCVLFTTGSSFDQRAQARDRIESYVVAGPLSRMRLYGNQLIGQKAILCYQPESEPLPDVGSVLVLSVEASGYTAAQQYVRITDVTHEVRTFTDGAGEFRRRVVTMKIGSSLQQTFVGAEVARYSTDASPTKVRTTQVADASRYYGIQPTTEAGDLGALTMRLASVYAPLVPSTQRETAVSLASAAGVDRVQQASTQRVSLPRLTGQDMYGSTPWVVRFPTAATPGSVQIRINVEEVYTDDGAGGLRSEFRLFRVDYASGEVAYVSGGNVTNVSVELSYIPAAEAPNAAHTRRIPVTLATRGTVYAETLLPVPAPGSLVLDYRALGRWYRLRDDGAGQLVANDPSEGTGSIDYVTGAVVVTLGALPDVDSAILMSWGTTAHYAIRAGATTDAGTTLRCTYQLAQGPVVPGTLSIAYPVAGVTRTATDAAANGTISGTGVSGTIDYATRTVTLNFSTPPDRAASLSSSYTWRDGAGLVTSSTTATISGGTFSLPGAGPFRAGGSMSLLVAHSMGQLIMPAYITTAGVVRVRSGSDSTADTAGRTRVWDDQAVGVLNTATGEVSLTAGVIVRAGVWGSRLIVSTGGPISNTWATLTETCSITAVIDLIAERDAPGFDPQAVSAETVAISTLGLQLDLTTTVGDSIVPGSVLMTVTGKTYADRNGTLFTDIDPTTGSGTQAGTIDYSTGVCTLTWWADGAAVSRSILSCLTAYGQWVATEASFRTAGSPIRPASLYVQVTAANGELLTATASENGVITGAYTRGTVEQTMGVVSLEWGELVTAAGNETEPWYDPDAVVGGQIWRPREVLPGTLRYNSVVLTSLPLDANILGLDPVRLPSDGRVPIYRPADIVVVHHTQRTVLPNPVTAGQTYSVGRTDCAVLRVEDANGDELVAGYVADPAAGTITVAADWTGAGVVQPLTIVDRIEHMDLLADVQINGEITLSAGLPRAFPVGSYVSSALYFGDMQAIVTGVLDQQTWTGVWSDLLIGSQAAAQYDDINYPIVVLNESAVTERWRINFTSPTAYQVIGENLGVIATGTTAADCSPINPVTGQPYFVIRSGGWGAGWAAGNQLRFNTLGANGPMWVARTILAGASLAGDSFDLEGRGDVDID